MACRRGWSRGAPLLSWSLSQRNLRSPRPLPAPPRGPAFLGLHLQERILPEDPPARPPPRAPPRSRQHQPPPRERPHRPPRWRAGERPRSPHPPPRTPHPGLSRPAIPTPCSRWVTPLPTLAILPTRAQAASLPSPPRTRWCPRFPPRRRPRTHLRRPAVGNHKGRGLAGGTENGTETPPATTRTTLATGPLPGTALGGNGLLRRTCSRATWLAAPQNRAL